MAKGTLNSTIAGCGFHHISIYAPNFDHALQFYRDVLGMREHLQFLIGERRFVLLDCGDGSFIELQEPEQSSSGEAAVTPLAHFALAVDDVNFVLDKARQAGSAVTMEPKQINLGGKCPAVVAFFTGPSGESVELFQEL